MKSIYEKAIVKKIILTNNYSISGKEVVIDINTEGKILTIDNLSIIRQLSNLEKIQTIEEFYFSFFNSLNLKSDNLVGIGFKRLLGTKKSIEYLDYLKEIVNDTIKIITSYHFKIFPDRVKCYKNLKSVYLEDVELEIPKYNHFGVTGRTSITSGFNFLTLKKQKRNEIKTRPNMNLIEVDFKSCEPFFYLKSQNIHVDNNDVYQWISSKYDIDIKNREYTKRGFLSMIYGANEKTVSRVMNIKTDKVFLIKKELGLTDLKFKLQKEFNENGNIFNYYGRPITSDSNLVNYWIQSSTVDFCSLAFKYFADNNSIFPNFFVHDSMTFSVDKRNLAEILKINALNCPVSEIKIPVEFNVIA